RELLVWVLVSCYRPKAVVPSQLARSRQHVPWIRGIKYRWVQEPRFGARSSKPSLWQHTAQYSLHLTQRVYIRAVSAQKKHTCAVETRLSHKACRDNRAIACVRRPNPL